MGGLSTLWSEARDGKSVVQLPICRRADGSSLELTLLVTHGSRPGPTLALIAGVHGDEYEGPEALWITHEAIRPHELAGTLVLLPVTNPPAYEAGSRVNPVDPKDLARIFPGSESGTVTEQIAWNVQHKVIAHADFLCDFHSAGRLYRIDLLAGYALVPEPALLAKQRAAALVLGYPLVWGTPLREGRTLGAAWHCRVPALYVEAPGEGRAARADVERNVTAARQLMRHFSMLDEPCAPLPSPRVVEDDRPDAGYIQIQMTARHGGYFRPAVSLGESIEQGRPFGAIVDAVGRTVDEIVAACTGRVVFLRTFPVVNPGDSVGTIMELVPAR